MRETFFTEQCFSSHLTDSPFLFRLMRLSPWHLFWILDSPFLFRLMRLWPWHLFWIFFLNAFPCWRTKESSLEREKKIRFSVCHVKISEEDKILLHWDQKPFRFRMPEFKQQTDPKVHSLKTNYHKNQHVPPLTLFWHWWWWTWRNDSPLKCASESVLPILSSVSFLFLSIPSLFLLRWSPEAPLLLECRQARLHWASHKQLALQSSTHIHNKPIVVFWSESSSVACFCGRGMFASLLLLSDSRMWRIKRIFPAKMIFGILMGSMHEATKVGRSVKLFEFWFPADLERMRSKPFSVSFWNDFRTDS